MKSRHMIRVAGVAALLALTTACGGSDDDNGGEPIAGVDDGGEDSQQSSQPPDEEATGQEDGDQSGSDIELPEDVELIFDWETPEDPDEAAALAGAAEYMRSIAKGVVEQDPDDPTYQGYSQGDARNYARTQIGLWVDGGWTMHGTDRFYDAETRQAEEGQSVGVEFCHDESEMVGKDAETGEPLPPTEYQGDEYLYHYSIVMVETVPDTDFWQAMSVDVEEEASQCRA